MSKPSVKIKVLPNTLKKLKNLKPVIEQQLGVTVEAACKYKTVKEVESLRRELAKDYTRYSTRCDYIIEEMLRAKKELEKVFEDCVTNQYDNADLELSKISNKLKDKALSKKAADREVGLLSKIKAIFRYKK